MSGKPLVYVHGEGAGLHEALASCAVRSTRSLEDVPDLILFTLAAEQSAVGDIAQLRTRFPEAPVLVVGHDPGPRRVVELLRAGAQDWVLPPTEVSDVHQLEGAIQNALLQRRLKRQGRDVLDFLEGQSRQVEEDRRLLDRRIASMGAQLEAANAQLAAAHRELQGRVAQLVMLYRIGRDLSNDPNWDEALSRFLRSLTEFLGARGAALLLTSQGGARVTERSVVGLDNETVARACALLSVGVQAVADEPFLFPLEEFTQPAPVPCVDRSEPWRETVLPLRHRERNLGYLLLDKDYLSSEAIGEDVYFLITVQTILTEEVAQAQAVSELRKLQQFQLRTLDEVESGIVTIDGGGHLLYANHKGRELLGNPALGEALSPTLRMGGEAITLLGWSSQAAAGTPIVGEAWLSPGEEEPIPVALRASQIPADLPGEFNTIVLLDDLRATRQLEAERRRAARQDELLIMAAEWAHDVRTPLTGILHSAELLCGALPQKSHKRRHFEVVRSEVDRINALVSNFLDFARPVRLKRASTDAVALADETVQLLGAYAAQRDVRLELRLQDESYPSLVADRDQLKQVLLNLLTNAIDASPDGGRITLRMGCGDAPPEIATQGPIERALVICVEDEGAGVAAEHIDRLFVPFFTTKPEGTGLGLAISEKVIRAHHGHLRYERRGKRTIMRVVLPVTVPAGSPTVGDSDGHSRLQARG